MGAHTGPEQTEKGSHRVIDYVVLKELMQLIESLRLYEQADEQLEYVVL